MSVVSITVSFSLRISQYIVLIVATALVELTDLYDVDKVDGEISNSTFHLQKSVTAKMRELANETKITLTGLGNLAVLLDQKNEFTLQVTPEQYLSSQVEKNEKEVIFLRLSPFAHHLLTENSKK